MGGRFSSVLHKVAARISAHASALDGMNGPCMPRLCRGPGKGEALLAQARNSGKPITPAMVKMAEWMDKMDEGGMNGDAPMLKPGELHCMERG